MRTRVQHRTLAAAGLLVTALSTNAWGVEAISETYVATCTELKGKEGDRATSNYIALTTLRPVESAGDVGTINGDQLIDPEGNWEADQYQNGSHYVQFDNGVLADIDGNSADTLVLAGDISGRVNAGDGYRIRPHTTIGDIFGPNNEAGLIGGLNPSDSDMVYLFNPETQATEAYWYSTIPNFEGWRNLLMDPAADQRVYPEQGVIVQRTVEEELCLTQLGPALDGPAQVPVGGGFSLLGTLQPYNPMGLIDLGLYTGDPGQGFAGATNPADGDNLLIVDDQGGSTRYWYSEIPGVEGWRDILLNPAGGITIAPGQSFFIHRKSDDFFWTLPAP